MPFFTPFSVIKLKEFAVDIHQMIFLLNILSIQRVSLHTQFYLCYICKRHMAGHAIMAHPFGIPSSQSPLTR